MAKRVEHRWAVGDRVEASSPAWGREWRPATVAAVNRLGHVRVRLDSLDGVRDTVLDAIGRSDPLFAVLGREVRPLSAPVAPEPDDVARVVVDGIREAMTSRAWSVRLVEQGAVVKWPGGEMFVPDGVMDRSAEVRDAWHAMFAALQESPAVPEDGSAEEDPAATRAIVDALRAVGRDWRAPIVDPAVPSPGPCPSPGCYGRQRRERGEVRTSVWRCGCAVRPRAVLPHRHHADLREIVWCADGHDVHAYHPTRDGAIAAWREALAEAQRREDEAARSTFAASPRWDEVPTPTPAQTIADIGRGAAIVGVAMEDVAAAIGRAVARAPRGEPVRMLGLADWMPEPHLAPLAESIDRAVEHEMTARAAAREADAVERLRTADLDTLIAVANGLAQGWPERAHHTLGTIGGATTTRWERYGDGARIFFGTCGGRVYALDDFRALVIRLAQPEAS